MRRNQTDSLETVRLILIMVIRLITVSSPCAHLLPPYQDKRELTLNARVERRVLLKRPIKIVGVRWGEENGGRSFVWQLIWHDHITCVKHATHCSFHLGAYWLVSCIRTAFKLRHSIVSLLITKSGAKQQSWLMASLVYFQKQNWLVENIAIGLGLG